MAGKKNTEKEGSSWVGGAAITSPATAATIRATHSILRTRLSLDIEPLPIWGASPPSRVPPAGSMPALQS